MTPDQMADRVVHVVGIGLETAAAITIVVVTAIDGNPGDLVPILICAGGLVAMLGCSAAFNVFHTSARRDWLRRFDHAAIFAMIAGTYTPLHHAPGRQLGHGSHRRHMDRSQRQASRSSSGSRVASRRSRSSSIWRWAG